MRLNPCKTCAAPIADMRRKKYCGEDCYKVQRRVAEALKDRSDYYQQRHQRDRERRNARALARYYRIKADPIAFAAHRKRVRETRKINRRAIHLAHKAGIPIQNARRILNAEIVARHHEHQ